MEEYFVKPISFIRSELKNVEDTPMFYTEEAPNARLELIPVFRDGLDRMQTDVFLTRSPDRPNPLGLHRARVLEMNGDSLLIGPIEAIDGTPVLDIKPVVEEADDF